MGIVCLFHCQNETQINSCISNANFICFIPRHSHSHQSNNRREHVLAFTASKFFPRLAIFLLKWAKIQCIQCLQSFPFSVAILLHCHCKSVLRASCPGPIAISIPIPNAARQLARLLLRLESVCQQVEWEMRWAGEAWQGAGAGTEGLLLFTCRWLAFAFVTHLFWFVYHCDLYFFVFSHSLPRSTLYLPSLSSLCISLLLLFQSRK